MTDSAHKCLCLFLLSGHAISLTQVSFSRRYSSQPSQDGHSLPLENQSEAAALNCWQSVPMCTCCMMGSQASLQMKAPKCPLLEDTLASLLSHSLAKQSRFFHLCFQGEYAQLYRSGLEIRKMPCTPKSPLPWPGLSWHLSCFKSLGTLSCVTHTWAVYTPSASLGWRGPSGLWNLGQSPTTCTAYEVEGALPPKIYRKQF